MTIEILMPAIGSGTTQGKIVQWLKKEGDRVSVGDILAEIETDKAVIDLEAFDDGVLETILVNAGDADVAVGTAIARLSVEAASGDAVVSLVEPPALDASHKNEPTQNAVETDEAHSAKHRGYVASPSARRLARELDVDIAFIEGTGFGGRIVRIDIERAAVGVEQHVDVLKQSDETTSIKSIPHTTIRKTIARRLQEAKQQIPHFYLSIDCSMDAIMAMRGQLNAEVDASKDTAKISVTDILVFAIARAVRHVPEINVRWTDEVVIQNAAVDVSVAVSTEKGLLTPVIKNANQKSLGEIVQSLKGLIEKARAGRLKPEEYEGGSITISNLGMYGIKQFSAIINPPQAAILAVGAVMKQAVVKDDVLGIGHVMNMTLSADHRAIDGAVAAKFLAELKGLLESPYRMLM